MLHFFVLDTNTPAFFGHYRPIMFLIMIFKRTIGGRHLFRIMTSGKMKQAEFVARVQCFIVFRVLDEIVNHAPFDTHLSSLIWHDNYSYGINYIRALV